MRPNGRLRVLAIGLSALVMACSNDSTSPSPGAVSGQIARHIDSLVNQALALAAGGQAGYAIRAQILSFAEKPPAFGVAPLDLSVQTNNGVEHWKGFESEEADTNTQGVFLDSIYELAAYSDSNLSNVIIAWIPVGGDSSSIQGEMIANDTVYVFASSISGTASTASVLGRCSLASGLTDTGITQFYNLGCTLDGLDGSVTLTFPPVAGVSNIPTSVTFSGHFHGPRLVYQDFG
jgi:hypothetical protein